MLYKYLLNECLGWAASGVPPLAVGSRTASLYWISLENMALLFMLRYPEHELVHPRGTFPPACVHWHFSNVSSHRWAYWCQKDILPIGLRICITFLECIKFSIWERHKILGRWMLEEKTKWEQIDYQGKKWKSKNNKCRLS